MIKTKSLADHSVGMAESARRLEALKDKCQAMAEELGAAVMEEEDKFIIDGKFGGWVRYFVCNKYINLNSKKGTIVHKITYEQDGDKYVDMIVGDTSIARVLEEGLYDDLRNLNVRCYDLNSWLDSCAVCRLEVPKNLVNWRTEDVDICPLERFDCGGLCTLKTSWDLFMEWRAREKSKQRIEEACANCDDDLPF